MTQRIMHYQIQNSCFKKQTEEEMIQEKRKDEMKYKLPSFRGSHLIFGLKIDPEADALVDLETLKKHSNEGDKGITAVQVESSVIQPKTENKLVQVEPQIKVTKSDDTKSENEILTSAFEETKMFNPKTASNSQTPPKLPPRAPKKHKKLPPRHFGGKMPPSVPPRKNLSEPPSIPPKPQYIEISALNKKQNVTFENQIVVQNHDKDISNRPLKDTLSQVQRGSISSSRSLSKSVRSSTKSATPMESVLDRLKNSIRQKIEENPDNVYCLWKNFTEVKESDIITKLTNAEIYYQEAMMEIITSEARYQRGLNVILDVYMNANVFSSPNTKHRLINPIDKYYIFANIKEIQYASDIFLTDMETRWSSEKPLMSQICDIVLEHTSSTHFFEYVQYIRNKTKQNKVFQKINESDLVQKDLKRIERSRQSRGLSLDSYLMTPLQRLTRLKLLCENVFKALHHSDLKKKIYDGAIVYAQKSVIQIEYLLNNSQKGFCDFDLKDLQHDLIECLEYPATCTAFLGNALLKDYNVLSNHNLKVFNDMQLKTKTPIPHQGEKNSFQENYLLQSTQPAISKQSEVPSQRQSATFQYSNIQANYQRFQKVNLHNKVLLKVVECKQGHLYPKLHTKKEPVHHMALILFNDVFIIAIKAGPKVRVLDYCPRKEIFVTSKITQFAQHIDKEFYENNQQFMENNGAKIVMRLNDSVLKSFIDYFTLEFSDDDEVHSLLRFIPDFLSISDFDSLRSSNKAYWKDHLEPLAQMSQISNELHKQ